jgi:hydroxymethylbilane synthase
MRMEMPFADRPLRLGTRASPLAMRQAEMTRDALIAAHGWRSDAVELVPVVASGDKILDRALAEVGGKALWTRELDVWLAEGKIDASVHSMKDVETIRPSEFVVAAMLPRADVRDRLVGADSIDALPQAARIGTSSPRRTAQLLRLRPDLKPVLLRGNVGTRLGKIEAGEADATMLAAAGLDRLGMHDTGVAIADSVMLPAPSQGAVGIEVLAENAHVRALVSAINHDHTHRCVEAERELLAELGADCRSPVAALATIKPDGAMYLRAELLAMDGSQSVADEGIIGEGITPTTLARRLLDAAPPTVRALFAG